MRVKYLLVLVFLILSSCDYHEYSHKNPEISERIIFPTADVVSNLDYLVNPVSKEIYEMLPELLNILLEDEFVSLGVKESLASCVLTRGLISFDMPLNIKDADCVIIVSEEIDISNGRIVAFTANSNSSKKTIPYIVIFPYELSKETWIRILYHEAIHLDDFMKGTICNLSETKCVVDSEYMAINATTNLFIRYLRKNGFTLDDILAFEENPKNSESAENQRFFDFVEKNAVSIDEKDLIFLEIEYAKEKLNNNLYSFIEFLYTR